ncbi:MAG TPA: SCO family protein [Blastocatellia bacterium]|nr:SCO family protein [Blastocatellia bacterium]
MKAALRQLAVISFAALCLFAPSPRASAQSGPGHGPLQTVARQDGKPKALQDIGIEQRLNEQLPLDVVFRDETGREVRLGDYFGKKPVILSLVYYNCPMLCNQVLTGLVSCLDILKFDVGREFDVLTVSFDPRETPAIASDKKQGYIGRYKRPGAGEGWHFLTGDQESIDRLTRAVGFKYTWDEETKQFAHSSGIMVLTPEGKLSRYFYGIEYAPVDVRLGLIEASENKIGSPVDAVLLYCYHYDPTTGKYGPVVMNLIRLGGVITIIGILALLLIMRRRSPVPDRASVGGTA